MKSSPRALVVGASAAGLSAADGLRDGGWEGDITVLGAERHLPYDRPALSKALLFADVAVEPRALRTPEQVVARRIDLQVGVAATGLDIDRHLVVTDHGHALPYDALIIATGSQPRPLFTASGERLPVLRNLDDLARVQRLVGTGRPVTLIGAGFIGLEVAATLRARDVPVTVLGSQRSPLTSSVGDCVGEWLHGLHRSHGVELRNGVKAVSVSGSFGDYRIDLDDGTYHRAEVILAAAGADPTDAWLAGSGLALNKGVLCGPDGRTSVPDVWAAGDVARVEDPRAHQRRRFEHWTNAIEQGRQVGLNVAGAVARPTPGMRSFWTEQYGRTLRVLGSREHDDVDVAIEGDLASGRFVIAHARQGETHAITSCGFDRTLRGYRKLLQRDAPLSEFKSLTAEQLAST